MITRIGVGTGDDLVQRKMLLPGEVVATTFEVLPIAAGLQSLAV